MINPYEDFKDYRPQRQSLPLERLVASQERMLASLVQGYGRLVEQEVKSLVWFVEHNRVIEAYQFAVDIVKELEYDGAAIEEFCHRLEQGDTPLLIAGPVGIYVAALCNQVDENEIVLHLHDLYRPLHFLGYRLPYGKSLRIEGNVGNFAGCSLQGGTLLVNGSSGDWTGAGMVDGKITVVKNAGRNTGEWMQGGEIWVGGRIAGLGRSVSGKIYQAGDLIT